MPFTDGNDLSPEPTTVPSSPPTYSAPSNTDMAAVAITVSLVGVIMFALITWLVIRLRRASASQPGFSTSYPKPSRPTSNVSNMSYRFRPSFAPSEASSKFGFTRKPLRLAHQREDGSWDFADRDPSKENAFEKAIPSKHRPAPLSTANSPTTPTPLYSPRRPKRSSTYKDESGLPTPSAPSTPSSMEFVEPPPPAYCKDGTSWPLYHPKDLPPC